MNEEAQPEVSIIVAVYNSERYLEQCLSSVVNQDMSSIEVLLIEDGSTDSSPEICERYAATDPRIRLVKQTGNFGMGRAYNTGLRLARAKYVGFVESDDFIESDMYSKLLRSAQRFDADVVISSFYYYSGSSVASRLKPDIEISEFTPEDRAFTISECPDLFTVHPSIWAKLFRRSLAQKITLPEFPGGGYVDGCFVAESYCLATKVVATHRRFYYYRIDNSAASSGNARRDKSLMIRFDAAEATRSALRKHGKYELLKKQYYIMCTKSIARFYSNIEGRYKEAFFERATTFYRDLEAADATILDCFNARSRRFVECVLTNQFRASLWESYRSLSLLGLTIYEDCSRRGNRKTKVLGIPVVVEQADERFSLNRSAGGQLTEATHQSTTVLGGLFYMARSFQDSLIYGFAGGFLEWIRSKTESRLSVCGLPVATLGETASREWEPRVTAPRLADNGATLIAAEDLLRGIDDCTRRIDNLSVSLNVLHHHSGSFLQFRGAFEDREVVLVACGPTAQHYHFMPWAIHVGVNRAFQLPNATIDYLFIQDRFPEGMESPNAYRPSQCSKFYGVLPEARLRELLMQRPPITGLSLSDVSDAHASVYFLESQFRNRWATDLAHEPLGDFGGTVFSAMQFILYGRPKRVYLVGCDCSLGHAPGAEGPSRSSFSGQLAAWRSCRRLIDTSYPDTEVISVNPVNLGDLFPAVTHIRGTHDEEA